MPAYSAVAHRCCVQAKPLIGAVNCLPSGGILNTVATVAPWGGADKWNTFDSAPQGCRSRASVSAAWALGMQQSGCTNGCSTRRQPANHQARAGTGDQFLRHGQRLFDRGERGDPRARAEGLRPARRGRHRHQGAWQDARGAERRRALAQGDPERDRQQPASGCRPITWTSTRSIAGITRRPSRRRWRR
jgi:hypothetical protein